MTEQLDTFVIELGRASTRLSRSLRGLSRADADDVVAQALLDAWEQRADAPADLWPWFRGLVRGARRTVGGSRGAHQRLEAISAAPAAEYESALLELHERIDAEVDAADKPLLELYAQGYSVPEIATSIQATPAFVRGRLRTIRRKLGPMRKWLPELPTTVSAPTSQPPKDAEIPPIDHDIEKLLRRPVTPRGDCPVCWRCCWFEGLAPPRHFVLEGVQQRKREIAQAISAGTIQELRG